MCEPGSSTRGVINNARTNNGTAKVNSNQLACKIFSTRKQYDLGNEKNYTNMSLYIFNDINNNGKQNLLYFKPKKRKR